MASSLSISELNHSFHQEQTMVCFGTATISTMVEFKERLKAAMEHANATREMLRSTLKVSRVAIDKLLDGRSKSMTAENCAIAARMLGVNIYWLATGIGSMTDEHAYPPTESIQRVVADTDGNPYGWPMKSVTAREYSRLSEYQRGLIEGQIRAMLDTMEVKSNGGSAAA